MVHSITHDFVWVHHLPDSNVCTLHNLMHHHSTFFTKSIFQPDIMDSIFLRSLCQLCHLQCAESVFQKKIQTTPQFSENFCIKQFSKYNETHSLLKIKIGIGRQLDRYRYINLKIINFI